MKINFLIVALAALIPLVLGFVWYNPKVFGNAWMKASGMTPEKAKNGNMPLILGLSLLFAFLLSIEMNFIAIHQFHLGSMLMGEPGFGQEGSEIQSLYTDLLAKYGNNFRTFKHGALHGGITAIGIALPIIGINALFERRGFKYIFIHTGYWFVTLIIMGGILCQFIDLKTLG